MQQQSPRTGNNNGARFSIIGEKGAAALDAYSYQNNLGNLQTAKQMLEAGKDAADIKLATGWEKGGDGKWRMEVPDLTVIIKRKLPDGNEYNIDNFAFQDDYLENIVNAPELFSAYGRLRRIRVRSVDLDSLGSYSKQNNTIYLNYNDFINLPTSKQELLLRSVLIHEVQHAIQDIEGFASGGNTGMLMEQNSSRIAELETRKHEIEQEIENGDTSNEEELQEIEFELNQFDEEIGGFDYYKRLAGEVEARNAERRQFFTEEEKRNSLLEASADVAEESKIYLFDNSGESQMAEEELLNKAEQLKNNIITEIDSNVIKATADKSAIQSAMDYVDSLSENIFDTEIGEIEFDSSSVKESLSHTIYQNKLDAIQAVPDILTKGIYLGSAADKDGKPIINHYFAGKVNIGGNTKIVFVRTKKSEGRANRFYVHEVFTEDEITKLGSQQTDAALANTSRKYRNASEFYRNIIAKVLNYKPKNQEKMRFSIAPQVDTPEFKNWFGDSKVVDENGKPLVVYHGTNADFNIFDTEKFGAWDNGSKFKINGVDENGKMIIENIKDEGFFFSSKKRDAEGHANGAAEMAGGSPRVISAYLKAEKPLIIEIDEFYADVKRYDAQDWYDHNTAEILEQFHSGDYDSIIIKNPVVKNDSMYVVFNPTQIKSATDNVGTFDSNNPDIRFSENQRVDVRKQHAWAKALAKVVGHTFIDYGAAEDELRRQGIDYSPDRDGRTLHAALIEARDNLRQRINRRVKAKNLKFMQSKDEFFKILSTKYGEDFKINAGENVASPVCRRYKFGKTTCSRS